MVAVAVGIATAVGIAVGVGVTLAVGVTVTVDVTLRAPPRTGRRVVAAGIAVRALVAVSESAGVDGIKVVAPGASFCSGEGGFVGRMGLGSLPRNRLLNVPVPARMKAPTIRATSITIP
jgi:hypothetical protein